MHTRNLRTSAALFIVLPLMLLATACENPEAQAPSATSFEEALASLDTIELIGHVQTLASDVYYGRAPSTPGERITLDYLQEQFLALGYHPGGEIEFSPSMGEDVRLWTQEVPLVSITAEPEMTLTIEGNGASRQFAYGSEFVATSPQAVESVELDASEMIFVGYGIVAPEYDWNDYAGVDVEGKTVVALVNDPGFATQDTALFEGNAMTYYGRWTYKYEEAGRQGAAAILLVHQTEPAAYGWSTVENGWTGTQYSLVEMGDEGVTVDVEGWMSLPTTEAVFTQAGLDFQELYETARTRDFEAVPMDLQASLAFDNTLEESVSHNFLAYLQGNLEAHEVIMYMGHWDHFGIDPSLEGDSIFNGARDNASGIGAMLELAEAFALLDPQPQRSIVFMATTAEEQGLLGSTFYARNPIYPLNVTAAVINIDALPIWGPTNDYVVVGHGKSELDAYAQRAAEAQGRTVEPNPEPEKGSFFRSDHFPLAKVGVPAHYGNAGFDVIGESEEWGREQSDQWTAQHYHQPSDEYREEWNLGGALQDMELWFRLGVELGYSEDFPMWHEGTEFRAVRDSMMQYRR